MSILDDAIERLRYHALATKYDATHTIEAAPAYPPESGGTVKPFAVTYINGARMTLQSYDTHRFFPSFAVDFHFSLDRFKTTYAQINTVIPDFIARLAGDPTLNGSVSTISGDVIVEPPVQTGWGKVGVSDLVTLMVRVTVPVKLLESPTT